MARSPRAVLTRIAATVTARYFPASGAFDGFYLDGRPSGRREHRAADITLDREDRGFFFSVFANASGVGPDEVVQGKIRKALDRIHNETHLSSRNIDGEINELAECAVSVAGRITLHHEGTRQPYFAGVVIKDSELAAVTMGSGCAYLYRGDVLYPLTADDYPLDAIDGNGKPVQGMDVYCAGVAGTVRYSNIAQLQLDDCVIVCNKEIMDSLGQRDILRMLYEAEDQADAAGLIITAASAKLPGVPLQIMISFVENISSADRGSRALPIRPQTDSVAASRQQPPADDFASEEFIPAPISNRDAPVAPVKSSGRQNEVYDDEDDYEEVHDSGRGRRIAFYIVIAIISIGCIYAIWSMLSQNKPTTNTTQTPSITDSSSTLPSASGSETIDPTATTTPTTTPTTPATTAPAGSQSYTVVSGDSLTSIANKFYGSSESKYIELIRTTNSLASADMIYPGQVLTIPPKP